ncbi:hypothetical protein AYI69_g9319 [Smittium culicis]|uniref:Uncharacterized protein n=1 Tax=Smittium culicis TaxID=133412 RepID=A0A1R1XDI7_9FUNG|nr:hypothetical protein AYI69_g9319 [Smittium culicis]
MNLLETTEYSDEFKNITMPSCSGLSHWKVAHKEHEELSKIGEGPTNVYKLKKKWATRNTMCEDLRK